MDRKYSDPNIWDNSIDCDDEPDGSDGGYTKNGSYILPSAMRELVRLRAELAEAPVWRPISTAPIEGRILLWRAHGTVPIVARFDPIYGEFEDAFGDHVYNVTHWMPLPAAPNEIDAAMAAKGDE